MKSLILAFIFFGVVVYGCFDVQPFRAIKRVLRRSPSKAGTAPLQQPPVQAPHDPYRDYQPPEYPVRRRQY